MSLSYKTRRDLNKGISWDFVHELASKRTYLYAFLLLFHKLQFFLEGLKIGTSPGCGHRSESTTLQNTDTSNKI